MILSVSERTLKVPVFASSGAQNRSDMVFETRKSAKMNSVISPVGSLTFNAVTDFDFDRAIGMLYPRYKSFACEIDSYMLF